MWVGATEYLVPTYVVRDLSCDIILGIDFVQRSGLVINGKAKSLLLENKQFNFDGNKENESLNNLNEKLEEQRNCWGKTIKNVSIPPHTLCYIDITGPSNLGKDYFTQPIFKGFSH